MTALCCAITAGATMLAGPLAARDLSGVVVETRAPTTVTVQVAGLTRVQVRQRIGEAAAYVCHNAVANRDLDSWDLTWCQFRSADRAMGRYRAALHRSATLVSSGPTILIAAR
jgi:hypothetical protein